MLYAMYLAFSPLTFSFNMYILHMTKYLLKQVVFFDMLGNMGRPLIQIVGHDK